MGDTTKSTLDQLIDAASKLLPILHLENIEFQNKYRYSSKDGPPDGKHRLYLDMCDAIDSKLHQLDVYTWTKLLNLMTMSPNYLGQRDKLQPIGQLRLVKHYDTRIIDFIDIKFLGKASGVDQVHYHRMLFWYAR